MYVFLTCRETIGHQKPGGTALRGQAIGQAVPALSQICVTEHTSASFLANRDQQESVAEGLVLKEVIERNTGWHAVASDLSTIIDVHGENQVQSRVGRDQGVQIDHWAAVLPQKRRGSAWHTTNPGCTHNLAL